MGNLMADTVELRLGQFQIAPAYRFDLLGRWFKWGGRLLADPWSRRRHGGCRSPRFGGGCSGLPVIILPDPCSGTRTGGRVRLGGHARLGGQWRVQRAPIVLLSLLWRRRRL